MQSNYNNRDFEQFVQQNADQYRMFPSEKVWKGIHSSLHTRRRWYGIGLAFLLLGTAATVTLVMLVPSAGSKKITTINSGEFNNNKNNPATQPVVDSRKDELVRKPVGKTILFTDVNRNDNANDLDLVVVSPAETVNNPIEEIAITETQVVPVINHPSLANNAAEADLNARKSATSLDFSIPVRDDEMINTPAESKKKTADFIASKKPELPYTIESVTNAFKSGKKARRFSYQLYFTPTISYRKLSENKAYVRSDAYQRTVSTAAAPYNYLASITDVNNVVTHRPDLGLELGFSAGYQATHDIKFKAGLQFNVSRYDIKAFTYNGEVATLALNNGNDIASISTNLRNDNGYNSNWLQNLYFSVAAPVGVEYKLGESGKTSVSIAGTLQPSYVLSDRSYLISSDYKNYAQASWLMRRMNLTTSIETFVTINGDKLKWTVGPQVRYQMLSSFKQKYPVRENIYDFGLKVGIIFNH